MTINDTPNVNAYEDRVSPDQLEWLPLPEPGNFIKPLRVTDSGDWAILLKIAAGTVEPRHRHVGSVSAYIIEGTVEVFGEPAGPGSFIYELDGAIHEGTTAISENLQLVQGSESSKGLEFLDEDHQVIGFFDYREAFKHVMSQAAG
jgi:anti-sigma factor ChrR (cupin superfamily)